MGLNLKLARIRAGVKQKDLAKELHISPATLIKWEKGIEIENIRLKTMKQVAELLNSSIKELFLSE